MKLPSMPFNIDILIPNKDQLRLMRPVKVLDIFEGKTHNFHQDGLFSIETFGKVGDERRSRQFSYIDIKANVFHPIIYKKISDLKSLYRDIMASSRYAIWDEDRKDFFVSDQFEGETGYSFFMEHFHEIEFEKRPSIKREESIKLIEKYKDRCTFNKLLVLPAGLRDFEFDDNGRPSKDEVNDLYMVVLGISNLITEETMRTSIKQLDITIYKLQRAINEIYFYFQTIMDGKKKFTLAKWASRKIYNSSRNVITSLVNEVDDLDSPTLVSANQTTIGLYQFLKNTLPVTIYNIKNGYLANVFQGPNEPAVLVNKKTLKKELIRLDSKHYDKWMTTEGLEQLITQFSIKDMRFMPLETENHYLGLIYKGPDMTFKIFQDIEDLPNDKSKNDVFPINFSELLYISVYKNANKIPLFFTRYPVLNFGSIYPSKTFLKTTIKSEIRIELDDNWQPTENKAIQFPITGENFVDSMSPHSIHLGRLDADFDGDAASGTQTYSDNAILETEKYLNNKSFYLSPSGTMNFSASSPTINYILASITG